MEDESAVEEYASLAEEVDSIAANAFSTVSIESRVPLATGAPLAAPWQSTSAVSRDDPQPAQPGRTYLKAGPRGRSG